MKYGEALHRYPNLLNRNFTADRPNQKWATDISYIRTGQGFLYLSVIRDLYDNSIVAYKTGTEQTVNLVLNTIRAARRNEKVTAELQLHSDQGFQYTSPAYFKLIQEYGITPSCQDVGILMTMLWLKISFRFSKQIASTGRKLLPLKKLALLLTTIFSSTTTSAFKLKQN